MRIATIASTLMLLAASTAAQPVKIRVATFDLDTLCSEEVSDDTHPRPRELAEIIAGIHPNIILLTSVASGLPEGSVAQQFAERYLKSRPELPRYRVLPLPTNSGSPSGFDLNHDGKVTLEYPVPGCRNSHAITDEAAARDFAGDCYGYGLYPGQFSMALLVDDRLTIDDSGVRTFSRFPWSYQQGAFMPTDADGKGWHTQEQLQYVRLCSTSFCDIPIKLPNRSTLHLLCDQIVLPPTAPGVAPDENSLKRQHDEIKLIGDYIDDAAAIVDDNDREGGLERFASFMVAGNLAADPQSGSSFKDPVRRHLLSNRKINASFTPVSTAPLPGFEPHHTCVSKRRYDYVLPSADLTVNASGVWRHAADSSKAFPGSHFPVYIDIEVREPLTIDTTK